MAKENSTKWKILIATVAIDNLSELSFEVNNKLIDVTTKDSAGWEEYLPGLKGAAFSGSGIVDFGDANYTPDEIFTALTSGSLLAMECSDAVSGSKKYTFSAYFDKYSIDGGVEDAIKFSFSGKVTAAVTQGTTT